MGKFKVRAETEAQLLSRMEELGIHERDIVEKFVKGSGPGGQKINKSSSCVYLMHTPSGIEVKCQRDRSLAMNRFLARRELCDKLENRVLGERSARRQAQEKIRRQKRRRSRKAKDKMLRDKSKRSDVKKTRGSIRDF